MPFPCSRSLTHLPVILDPSHSTGHADYVTAVARAAIAAGADGLIIEVHPDPAHALSDGRQSLKPEKFVELVKQVGQIAEVMGRKLAPIPTTQASIKPKRQRRRKNMLIIMHPGASQEQVANVIAVIKRQNLTSHLIQGVEQTVIGAVGDSHSVGKEVFEILPGVAGVTRISQPYKLASRQFHPKDSVFPLDGFSVGGEEIAIIAGPCSVESRSQVLETAQAIREAGANALRGGVFKPRTSPYVFQGLGEEGLEYLAEARELTGMPIVAEVMSVAQVELMVKYVDVLQIGARNMQNYLALTRHRRNACPDPAQTRHVGHHRGTIDGI